MRKNNYSFVSVAYNQNARCSDRRIFKFILCLVSIFCIYIFLAPHIEGTLLAFADAIADDSLKDFEDKLFEEIDVLLNGLDLTELQEYLKNNKDLSNFDLLEHIKGFITGGESLYEDVFSAIFSVFIESLKQLLPSFVLVIGISLLCGIINSLKSNVVQNSTSEVIFYVSYCVVLSVLLFQLHSVFLSAKNAINEMKLQMEVLFPVLFLLMSASGGNVSVGLFRPAVVFLCGRIADIITDIVFPFSVIIIVLSAVKGLNNKLSLSGFTDLFKTVNKWLIGLSVTVFGIFLTTQGLTASTYDTISIRAVKYALSNTIPIVGNFLSGGFDIVLAGSIMIKNSIGIVGIVIMLTTIFSPLVMIASFSLLLKLSGAITDSIGNERVRCFLSSLNDGIKFLAAGLLAFAFLYFLTILLLICSLGAI